MLRVIGISTSYFEPTGLAAARMDVRAFKVVMIPRLSDGYRLLFLIENRVS